MNKFKPQSPDPFLKKDADMSLAKFGHLNAIVDEITTMANIYVPISVNSSTTVNGTITNNGSSISGTVTDTALSRNGFYNLGSLRFRAVVSDSVSGGYGAINVGIPLSTIAWTDGTALSELVQGPTEFRNLYTDGTVSGVVNMDSTNITMYYTDGVDTASIEVDTQNVTITSTLLTLTGLPIYADNAAALLGGLVADNVYKTVTGELRIVV